MGPIPTLVRPSGWTVLSSGGRRAGAQMWGAGVRHGLAGDPARGAAVTRESSRACSRPAARTRCTGARGSRIPSRARSRRGAGPVSRGSRRWLRPVSAERGTRGSSGRSGRGRSEPDDRARSRPRGRSAPATSPSPSPRGAVRGCDRRGVRGTIGWTPGGSSRVRYGSPAPRRSLRGAASRAPRPAAGRASDRRCRRTPGVGSRPALASGAGRVGEGRSLGSARPRRLTRIRLAKRDRGLPRPPSPHRRSCTRRRPSRGDVVSSRAPRANGRGAAKRRRRARPFRGSPGRPRRAGR